MTRSEKGRVIQMQPTFYGWAKGDPEAAVWYTAASPITGLNSSGETLDELRDRLSLLIPDFLEDRTPAGARLHIIAERTDDLERPQARGAVEIRA